MTLFLKELKNITVFDATHDGLGFSGFLRVNGDIQVLLKKYPEINTRQLQGCLLFVLKKHMEEERRKWYEQYYATGNKVTIT